MTPLALAALPIFLQAAASSVCPLNQFVTPTADVCYAIVPSVQKPGGVDAQFVDLTNTQYLKTEWLTRNTMLSKIETATTTYCWYDDKTADTFACK